MARNNNFLCSSIRFPYLHLRQKACLRLVGSQYTTHLCEFSCTYLADIANKDSLALRGHTLGDTRSRHFQWLARTLYSNHHRKFALYQAAHRDNKSQLRILSKYHYLASGSILPGKSNRFCLSCRALSSISISQWQLNMQCTRRPRLCFCRSLQRTLCTYHLRYPSSSQLGTCMRLRWRRILHLVALPHFVGMSWRPGIHEAVL
mmetsp:Transcript_104104/g.162296  ORF Transcript_104104/g.162296 Transcript_104104/m.162296 type:complete len:204 (+) Transcript_104104:242-853(+)